MLASFTAWLQRKRQSHAAQKSAWSEASTFGEDGYTNFERDAIARLGSITGKLSLIRGNGDPLQLSGPIPDTPLVLYLCVDEAQVHGVGVSYRKEKWDFDTPEDSVKSLVSFVREYLQSNNRIERPREP